MHTLTYYETEKQRCAETSGVEHRKVAFAYDVTLGTEKLGCIHVKVMLSSLREKDEAQAVAAAIKVMRACGLFAGSQWIIIVAGCHAPKGGDNHSIYSDHGRCRILTDWPSPMPLLPDQGNLVRAKVSLPSPFAPNPKLIDRQLAP